VIRVSQLRKRYGATIALDGLDFEVAEGEILGLLGPNGAGKTTTLRILTGLMPPDSGRAELGGQDLFLLGAALRRRTGYLPESNPLYLELSPREALDFFARLYGFSGQAREQAVAQALEACALTEVAHRPARELSRGYRQRLGLAQALVHDPELLFLDEPTAGLDPLNVRELRELIRGFGRRGGGRRTVVLSTHVLSEVEAVCDRAVILDRGRCAAQGPLAELSARWGGGERYALRVELPGGGELPWSRAPMVREARRLDEGGEGSWLLVLEPQDKAAAMLSQWIHDQGALLHEMRPVRPALEDVFLRVVKGEDGQ
jgi:ABC-2 type transport system ATP-binding protein